jgi:hypothetical protein
MRATSSSEKIGVSNAAMVAHILAHVEGENPNVIITRARLNLLSSSAYTPKESSTTINALLGQLNATLSAYKVSSTGTAGHLSFKISSSYISYSGIFLKLISVRFVDPVTRLPVSGLVPKLQIRRSTDWLSNDFADNQFKSAASCTQIAATMLETDSIYYPGVYNYFVQVNGWGDGEDIAYQLFVQDTANGYYADPDVVVFRDGVEQYGGLTNTQSTTLNAAATQAQVSALPTNVWAEVLEGAHTAGDIQRVKLSVDAGSGTVPNGNGSFQFKSPVDGTVRVSGTISGDTRTSTLVDGT